MQSQSYRQKSRDVEEGEQSSVGKWEKKWMKASFKAVAEDKFYQNEQDSCID